MTVAVSVGEESAIIIGAAGVPAVLSVSALLPHALALAGR